MIGPKGQHNVNKNSPREQRSGGKFPRKNNVLEEKVTDVVTNNPRFSGEKYEVNE